MQHKTAVFRKENSRIIRMIDTSYPVMFVVAIAIVKMAAARNIGILSDHKINYQFLRPHNCAEEAIVIALPCTGNVLCICEMKKSSAKNK